jgi:hypothetical protein
MKNNKKFEYIPQTPSTKSDNDSELKPIKKVLTFSEYSSDNKENYEKDSNIKKLNTNISNDDETKEKLENIRNNISNIREKVSSYSKIYDNISNKIENGISNVPKDELLKMENNKFKNQILEYSNENLRLKKKISELESELENQNKNLAIKYKKKFLNDMKEIQKIFEETIENKNKEIEKLNRNQEFLIKEIEVLKLSFNQEKNELKKYNDELLDKNFELQREISNIHYNNNQNFPVSNFNIMKNQFGKRRKSQNEELNLIPIIEEDKSISFSFANKNFNNYNNNNNNKVEININDYKSKENKN